MTFADRFTTATAFEGTVLQALHARGWKAWKFGQGQLPEECRQFLTRYEDDARHPTLIRWFPDILACRDINGRSSLRLIDVKVCNPKYSNYAIELSALETMKLIADEFYTPTFFVFDDWGCLSPRDVEQRGKPSPNGPSNGSGTAFLLVERRYKREFSSIFPG